MQLSEIEAYLAVVQTGSLSKASERLFVTQPTLSHRIQSLEKKLGVQLLIRNKGQRRVEPTNAGREFVLIAEKWSELWEKSKHLSALSTLPTFRVAATQTLSTYVMPTVYAKFVARGLPLSLELFSLHYLECYTAVEKKDIDAVFVSRIISSNRVSAIPICSERMVLLCNKASPYQGAVHPAELPADKGVYMLWTHSFAMWQEYWCGPKPYAITADSMRLAEKIIAITDRWAIVPISAAREVVHNNESMKYLPVLDSPPDRPIYLLTLEPQNEFTSLIVEDLISTIHPDIEE